MYPAFGIRGGSWFLGLMEWSFCLLLFWGYWNRRAGILGALGSCVTYVATITIIPFMPNGWDEVAGGFPAMTGNVPFLMKDVVLLAASFYLLKQDVVRATLSDERSDTASFLIKNLAKIFAGLGLLREDIEYHLLRASMVIIFAFFGYTKWHQYAAQLMIPSISHSHFFSGYIPLSACAGASVLGCVRVADLCPFVCRILGQEIRSYRCSWFNRYVFYHPNDHPVYPGWLGSSCGVSCDGWRGAIPDEGHCPSCCINLFAEAGRCEDVTFQQEIRNRPQDAVTDNCYRGISARGCPRLADPASAYPASQCGREKILPGVSAHRNVNSSKEGGRAPHTSLRGSPKYLKELEHG